MTATLVLVKTMSPAGDVTDVFDLDVDMSLGLEGCQALAASLVGTVSWAGDIGTAAIEDHEVSVEATEVGLLWLRFENLDQDSRIVQKLAAEAVRQGLAVIDEDSAEMLRGGLDLDS
jgi:hypothetical protein